MMIIPLVTCSRLGNELEARPFEFPDEVLPVIPMFHPVDVCEILGYIIDGKHP